MSPKHESILKQLDEQYAGAPFEMKWSEYEFVLGPNCAYINMVFSDEDGVRISIPLCRKDAKRLYKQLKKIEQVLL